MLGHQRADVVEVVEGRDQHLVGHRLRNPGAVGHRLGEVDQPRRRQRHLRLGRHAVIAAFELHDSVAAGEGAGGAHRVHVRLAARGDVAELLGAGDGADDLLGKLHRGGVVGEEGLPPGQLLENRLEHFRMAVPEQHRSGAEQVVDVFVARLVPDPRAAALADEDVRIEVAEAAARQHLAGALEPFGRGGCPVHGNLLQS